MHGLRFEGLKLVRRLMEGRERAMLCIESRKLQLVHTRTWANSLPNSLAAVSWGELQSCEPADSRQATAGNGRPHSCSADVWPEHSVVGPSGRAGCDLQKFCGSIHFGIFLFSSS